MRSPFPPGAPHVHSVSELAPNEDEAVFDKVTMSAFESMPLQLVLRDCGITAVAVLGVALEIGVEPTLRHATSATSRSSSPTPPAPETPRRAAAP